MLQVARDLQKVCRPNPRRFRPSCRKDKKQKPADGDASTVARAQTFEVSSDSELEIVVKPFSAMAERTFCSAEAYRQGHSPHAHRA